MRAAQSKGIVDLLALWPRETIADPSTGYGYRTQRHPWLVQCKYSIEGGGYLPAHEEIELVALAVATGAVPVLARPGKNGRGVEFIDVRTKKELS
jgi:hypothetical protein